MPNMAEAEEVTANFLSRNLWIINLGSEHRVTWHPDVLSLHSPPYTPRSTGAHPLRRPARREKGVLEGSTVCQSKLRARQRPHFWTPNPSKVKQCEDSSETSPTVLLVTWNDGWRMFAGLVLNILIWIMATAASAYSALLHNLDQRWSNNLASK